MKNNDMIIGAALGMIILGVMLGYLVWVGIAYLVFITFNITGYSVWLTGLVLMIFAQVLKSVFKR